MTPEAETARVGVKAAIGLGGNVGDVARSMASALRALDAFPDIRLLAVSALYRTPPWGMADQPSFFNACALMRTALTPELLLDACLAVERGLKRERDPSRRWGPRTIDIDILTFGRGSIDTERLKVPHPRMSERGFVLKPLADIAPEMTVDGRTVAQWLDDADTGGIERIDDGAWWRDGRAVSGSSRR